MQNLDDSSGAVSFQLGVQSHITAEKRTVLKITINPRRIFQPSWRDKFAKS
jgi:hypothetical protein